MPNLGWTARRLLMAGLITVTITALVALALWTGGLSGVTAQLNDLHFPTGDVDERLAVVELPLGAIDWDRSRHALLVDAISDAGAAAIGYDVVFDGQRPGSTELAAALARAGNVVLGTSARVRSDPGDDIPSVVAETRPLEDLEDAAAGVGHVFVLTSPVDGIVRHVPLVVEREDRRHVAALSLATVMVAELGRLEPPRFGPEGRDMGIPQPQPPPPADPVDARLVETAEHRILEVNWSLPFALDPLDRVTGTVVGADEVLAGGVDLTGMVVFVGIADPLLDVFPTPLNKATTPGVYVHANAANTMLTNLYRSGPDRVTTLAAVALLVGVVAFVGTFHGVAFLTALALGLLVLWQVVVGVAFLYGINLDNFWPNLAVLLASGAVVGVRYLPAQREQRRVANLFMQYVPDAVAQELIDSGRLAAAADGERIEVTVLFCDLRGFTATSATLAPSDVRSMLEVYYDHCTRIIQDHGGTVMQFVGDEVFAVFGAPVLLDDHAQRALDAATAMQVAAADINAELAARNVSVAYGIGLNSGEVIAAHVGSQVHKQYAVVGQTVNVGARLCSQALPGGIVLSKWTRAALTVVPELESLGTVSLKGVTDDPEPSRVLL